MDLKERAKEKAEDVCGSDFQYCQCYAKGRAGQTDFIPIESTSIVCKRRISLERI